MIIRLSTFRISSAKAWALKVEWLNCSLNVSNCDITSGVSSRLAFLSLDNEENAPSSPNNLRSLFKSCVTLFHLFRSSSIVFPSIANALFFVVKTVLSVSGIVDIPYETSVEDVRLIL